MFANARVRYTGTSKLSVKTVELFFHNCYVRRIALQEVTALSDLHLSLLILLF